MIANLLLRGMLAGIVAGLLTFSFLRCIGEPQVDAAIAFESHMDEQKTLAKEQADAAAGRPVVKQVPEPELVSRTTQAGPGLFTGVLVYNTAFGGLFALAFAFRFGRIAPLQARGTAVLIALLGFIAVYVVPSLKYPANPPSVGEPETIGIRTALYFSMVALSLAGMIAAGLLRGRLVDRLGEWTATLAAGASYLLAMSVMTLLLPGVNEVPETFPAVTLWSFRIASAGAQLIMWTTLGLVFGMLADQRIGAGSHGVRRGALAF